MDATQTTRPTLASGNHLPQHLRAPPCTNSSRGRSPFPARVCALDSADDSESERVPSPSPEPVPVVVDRQESSPPRPAVAEFPVQRRVSWQQDGPLDVPRGVSAIAPPRQFPSPMPSPPPSPERSRPSHVKRSLNQDDSMPETSADETTAILNSERGRPGAKRGYSSTSASHVQSSSQQSGVASPDVDAPRQAQSSSPSSSSSSTRAERRRRRRQSNKSWFKELLGRFGSVELENRGSVARDHLALERTFLAWLRTSLSFASIGIAVTQLFRLNTSLTPEQPDGAGNSSVGSQASPTTARPSLHHVGKPLGATFLAIGILVLAIGFHRYFESQHYVIMGKFPASRVSILLVSGVAGALIVASLAVILAVGPSVDG